MNALQFYYTREVLGIQTALKPLHLRGAYRLSCPLAQKTDFLFFCDKLKVSAEKTLVKNIAKALKAEEEQVVEILDFQSLPKLALFKNLLTRFNPKSFVIFGDELAKKLIPPAYTTHLNPTGEESKPKTYPLVYEQGPQNQVHGVVIGTISQLTSPDPAKSQKAKQDSWNVLHKTFLKGT